MWRDQAYEWRRLVVDHVNSSLRVLHLPSSIQSFQESFPSVTCLPGCFTLYWVRTADKERPIIISSQVIEEYAEPNVDTLHKKNLFSLGEDRHFWWNISRRSRPSSVRALLLIRWLLSRGEFCFLSVSDGLIRRFITFASLQFFRSCLAFVVFRCSSLFSLILLGRLWVFLIVLVFMCDGVLIILFFSADITSYCRLR